jgi:hypothetical protein
VWLFNWLRSKRPLRQPPPLQVRYGLGPPPPMPPDDLCPLCGGEVSEVRCAFHALEVNGLSRSIFWGRCSICDTSLCRVFASDHSPAWQAVVPAVERLGDVLHAAELETLAARFERLMYIDREWAEFLSSRRPGDEVRRFADEPGVEGFAVVRQGRPLAQFLVPEPNFEMALLEYAAKQAETGATPDRRS